MDAHATERASSTIPTGICFVVSSLIIVIMWWWWWDGLRFVLGFLLTFVVL